MSRVVPSSAESHLRIANAEISGHDVRPLDIGERNWRETGVDGKEGGNNGRDTISNATGILTFFLFFVLLIIQSSLRELRRNWLSLHKLLPSCGLT